ncbi:efflux RND transporter periplasmic adaptor subunit [Amphritea balenae]|uniref:HlyD family efflux transporter periplasmic adaptor subunit n=1 Tax=Amphritea balenae TaxID=452629 RepID=A0A3P1SNS9_9GAMM|nr:HlyD family efflux transporter periplasmic adaptor subunit [Amphritea balenae]RRC98901.1 HlyD family efflux transporter periplasmic adaptor subunit [Amphritea balenae]GGK62755.1 secretion protein HlyD [Amphritea balenae]
MASKQSHRGLLLISIALVLSLLVWAFMPRPLLVDVGKVTRGAMQLTIEDEGKTRVRDAYVVSTPVNGRLLRIDVEPGDRVEKGKTIIAQMLPANPEVLDQRTREQARAAVSSAEASVRLARAKLNKAIADTELSSAELRRITDLKKRSAVSVSALDKAQRKWRTTSAELEMAQATISMRQASLAKARAELITFSPGAVASTATDNDVINILAPHSGSILRVLQESETTLPAGQAILEIGDISKELEVVVELLSTDAVKVRTDDRVIIDNWGGPEVLQGRVAKVEPWGFTKFSALGVEEQRVKATIHFTNPAQQRASLGHGFRVEARIVIWEQSDALIVPSSALFRNESDWAVYTLESGNAELRRVEVGHNNGRKAEVLSGLSENEQVVLYPPAELNSGSRVSARP